jgi:hypothetical protein
MTSSLDRPEIDQMIGGFGKAIQYSEPNSVNCRILLSTPESGSSLTLAGSPGVALWLTEWTLSAVGQQCPTARGIRIQ